MLGGDSSNCQSCQAVRPGLGEGGDVAFDVSQLLIHKQITLHGSWVTSLGHMQDLLRHLTRWRIHPEAIVTHRFSIEDAGQAYELADRGTSGKVCVVFD